MDEEEEVKLHFTEKEIGSLLHNATLSGMAYAIRYVKRDEDKELVSLLIDECFLAYQQHVLDVVAEERPRLERLGNPEE
jgi:hypothetical protein